jgi:two-component system, OmpR family, sensor histidine kinase ArlS
VEQDTSLNIKQRGLLVTIWQSLMLLTIAILVMLWVLQIVFLTPYYRNMKTNDVRSVSSTIEQAYLNNTLNETLVPLIVNNNVCVSIYRENNQIFFMDALGVNCMLNRSTQSEPNFIDNIVRDVRIVTGTELTRTFNPIGYEREMLILGRNVLINEENITFLVNSPLDSTESTVVILRDQFVYVTFAVFILSSLMAFWIASSLSKPVVDMVKSANKFASFDFKFEFEPTPYQEFNELAQALNFAKEQLLSIDNLRKDMIANVSHDIKTPLTTIKAYTELLQEFSKDNPTKRKEHLNIIYKEVNHLSLLVSDMLLLTQYDSPNLNINLKSVHVKSWIEYIVSLFEHSIQTLGIHFVINVDEALVITIDEIKVGQVLFNFINNAINHVGEDNIVIINAYKRKGKVRVEVEDHGTGILSDELPNIWDRYYRIDKNFARNQQGTGLGLSIAKSICLAHNLRFGVDSTIGQGSVFYFDCEEE